VGDGVGTATLRLSGINQNVTLDGTGSITLGNTITANQTAVFGGAGGGEFVKNGNFILSAPATGTGLFGNNQIKITNNATITTSGTGSIDLNPNASGFINNGTITANDSLTLNGQGGGQFNNTNGTITLFSDGLVQLTNAVLVSGGTLMSS